MRHLATPRVNAAHLPRSEGDQLLIEGWPLYRTERGQQAFNDVMATLAATDGAAPAAGIFKGCAALECNLSLPPLDANGWFVPGRVWVSPTEYVLFAHSPRLPAGQFYRRRMIMDMRYFVFHEFHNSSRNIDPYDTISSHRNSVFVPLYMSKPGTDARGRRYVVVVQVAPYDVQSVHASNLRNAGSGMEVARNVSDAIEPLQNLAGILVATMIKTAAPRLTVVNHRGAEGLPMLRAYDERIAALRARPAAAPVRLPFVTAPDQRVATAMHGLGNLIRRPGVSPTLSLAERSAFLRPVQVAQVHQLIELPTLVARPACLTAAVATDTLACPPRRRVR
jgi:hypothetical protein